MNFKNVRVMRLDDGFTFPTHEQLEEKLFEYAFTECGKNQRSSTGFISPFGMQSSVLAHQVGSNILLKIRVEEKILPGAAINAALERKEQEHIEKHGEPYTKKQRREIKMDIAESMLPTAFTQYKDTDFYLDVAGRRIVIGVTSQKNAEDVTALLRTALESVPSSHWMGEITAPVYFTNWLSESVPGEIYLGADAEFRGTGEDDSKHSIKNDELKSDDVKALIDSGKECFKLALDLPAHASFSLDEQMGIKGIKMSDVLMDNQEPAEDEQTMTDVNFALWSAEINNIINALDKAIKNQEKQAAA